MSRHQEHLFPVDSGKADEGIDSLNPGTSKRRLSEERINGPLDAIKKVTPVAQALDGEPERRGCQSGEVAEACGGVRVSFFGKCGQQIL